jgi:lysophospholipid acyltransferase (LPLAT)-like uncharacterized protein
MDSVAKISRMPLSGNSCQRECTPSGNSGLASVAHMTRHLSPVRGVVLPPWPMKSLLRSTAIQRLLPHLFQRYLWLVLHTNRWSLDGAEYLATHAAGAPAVVGFWHEFLPSMPALVMLARRLPSYHPAPLHALVSRHRDGRFIGAVVRRFGVEPVHASSSRGGFAGSRELLRLLMRGAIICITPDGPRGPKRQAASGLAQLAALANVPILPCAARTSRRIVLNSWDRMAIPLPFGHGVVVCGPEIRVPRDGWREAMPAISAAMTRVAERADQLCAGA